MDIDFDPVKNRQNMEKHGISLDRALDMDLRHGFVEMDPRDYGAEIRFRAYGLLDERLYVMVYTYREGVVRVISLRKANKREIRKNDQKEK